MLGLLANEGVGFAGDGGAGEAGFGHPGRRDYVTLEGDCQEGEGVPEETETGIGRLPLERHRLVDMEPGTPYGQIAHNSQRYIPVPLCKVVRVMHGTTNPDAATTRERLLWATSAVLARSGMRKLSLSDVAAAADVSRPTLYRWFPSKEALLEAFGVYEQEKYDAGIAQAISGLEGDARLDAILRFIVEFQHTYSLRRIVDVEPEHVVHQMTRIMPIMRDRLLPHFEGPDGRVIATVVTRIPLSHALIPDDEPELFYAELRHVAGLESNHTNITHHRQRSVRPTSREKVS